LLSDFRSVQVGRCNQCSYGLETGSAASDYIQLWNGDAQFLTESLAYIRQAASQMLAVLTNDRVLQPEA
jgi:hypothetical protein